MKPISDLFGTERYLNPKGKPINERAGVLKFFLDQHFKHKDETPFTAQQMGVRCGHLKLDHLYTIQSNYKDIKNRIDYAAARKYFFWATKSVVHSPAT